MPLSLSTLADQVGACANVLQPIFERLRAHVLAAERLHGDHITVPVLARGECSVGRSWVYVRDDRPFGERAPPAAVFHYSPDRSGEHPRAHLANWTGILQADAYGGYGQLYDAKRTPAPIVEAACWSHARRKFFVLANLEASAHCKARGKTPTVVSPVALQAVQRIDALFDIDRGINGMAPDERHALRQNSSARLMADLHAWMITERAKLSRGAEAAKAMDYMLKRWSAFARLPR